MFRTTSIMRNVPKYTTRNIRNVSTEGFFSDKLGYFYDNSESIQAWSTVASVTIGSISGAAYMCTPGDQLTHKIVNAPIGAIGGAIVGVFVGCASPVIIPLLTCGNWRRDFRVQ